MNRKPYTKTLNSSGPDVGTREEHESFGVISFSRAQGGSHTFFGSALDNHAGHITMRIYPAARHHAYGMDSISPATVKPLIEIRLTAAQFAEAITSWNLAQGVPCTLSSFDGVSLEDPPKLEGGEQARSEEAFKQKTFHIAESISQGRLSIRKILEKKSLSKGDRSTILEVVDKLERDIRCNLPYFATTFEEVLARKVAQAKTEVDSFASLLLHRLGMNALGKKLEAGENPLLLEDKE